MMEEPPPLPPEWEAFVEPEPAVACEDPTVPLAFWAAKMAREGFSREQVARMLMDEAARIMKPVERRRRGEERDRAEREARARQEEQDRQREAAFRQARAAWRRSYGGGYGL